MKTNRHFFFEFIRNYLFEGRLSQSQVDGITGLLDYWEGNDNYQDDRWLAYALATAHHEVDRKMKPIKEYGSKERFFKLYDIEGDRPAVARRLGNIEPGDGVKFHGRGFIQLTGRANYQDWSDRLNIDLADDPDQALELDIATQILFEGMRLGTFTGKKLDEFFTAEKDDWKNARKIVNKLDKASLIGGYAKLYYAAISKVPF